MNIFSSHISFERLADLVEGRLPPVEQLQLLPHVSTCTRCATEKAWLERVTSLMRADIMEDVPPAIIARARRLLQPQAPLIPTERRCILALLRFDSLQQPLALGVRGGQATARQILVNAEEYDLDLRITPVGSAWQVSGQLLGPDPKGQIELQGPAQTVQAGCNQLGEFNLPLVSAGSYNFILRVADLDIELPRLDIGL